MFVGGFHVATRDEVIKKFPEFIKDCRADPELRCPDFCRRLRIDDAGEWGSQNPMGARSPHACGKRGGEGRGRVCGGGGAPERYAV